MSGWYRLWLFVSLVWVVLIGLATWSDLATSPLQIPRDEVYARMNPWSLGKLDRRPMVHIGGIGVVSEQDAERFSVKRRGRPILPNESLEDWDRANQRLWKELVSRGEVSEAVEPSVVERMPNGEMLRFRVDVSNADRANVVSDYHRALSEAMSAERRMKMRAALLWSLVPVLALYLCGRTLAWVRAGFTR
jgi:hypothetical protein